KHAGITIACLDQSERILIQHRRHRIFDRVWSLSGDTHPRKYGSRRVESLSEAARRCAREDLGVVINTWTQRLTVSYSARDPRDSSYWALAGTAFEKEVSSERSREIDQYPYSYNKPGHCPESGSVLSPCDGLEDARRYSN